MVKLLINFVRDSSIRFKLVAMMSLSCFVGISLCCCGFVLNDMRALEMAKKTQVEAQARMLAFNSSAVISFMQQEAGEELLAAYEAEQTVEQAALFSIEGDIIARYPRNSPAPLPTVESLSDGSRIDEDGRLYHTTAVKDAGERVGSLYVVSNMEDVYSKVQDYFDIAGLMMAVSMAVAFLFSVGVQSFFSRPVTDLARTVEKIRQEEDFSVRVSLRRQDELGTLYSAFNAMLARIEESKNDLRLANDHLEERVDQRTSQLRDEIREREKTRQQLIAAKEEAENANISKSMFLANMSHEIRTPMNAILGFTDVLRQQQATIDDEERDSYLETIHRSGQHLLGLINDILDLSKIEANRMELDLVSESPHQIVAEAISVMRVPALQKGLTLDYTWNGPVPTTVKTDPSRLRQMLLNLIGNAIKFTRHGGVKVSVEVTDLDANPSLKFEILDTGIGIPKQKLDEIFKPFSQADVTTTREFGGTGLGLTISRRIAQAMGGELQVSSAPGQGSVFTVTVPIGQIDRSTLKDRPPVSDILLRNDCAVTGDSIRLKTSSILLVEDGITNRRMITLLLRPHDVTVTEAENGQIAVDLATNRDFDLILMDMQMPVKDGYTATRELRKNGLQIPIIALTAHAMKGDREKCLDSGCTDYLTKPIDEERLVMKLAEFLPFQSLEESEGDLNGSEMKALKQQPLASVPVDAESVVTAPVEFAAIQMDPVISALPYDDVDYREIIDGFRQELTLKLPEMNQRFDQQQFSELAKLAHWLKGTAGTAGFDQFTIPAIRLERHAKASHRDEARTALDTIINLAERAQADAPDSTTAATTKSLNPYQ